MITPAHAQLMARYNRWQNQSLYSAADRLPDVERKRSRGAFFESIHGTLSHILFGDQAWMHRLDPARPAPKIKSMADALNAIPDWSELKAERVALDEIIIAWADTMKSGDIEGELSWYSAATGRQVTKPRWELITHMSNHQTHHRGQVHCLLTQNGLKMTDTDIPFMPE